MKAQQGSELYLYSFFNLIAEWGSVVNAMHRLPYNREIDPVTTVEDAGWAPGPV